MKLDKLETTIQKKYPNEAIHFWTQDAAEWDFEFAMDGEEIVTKFIYTLISKNLKTALKSKNKYINTFAKLLKQTPNQFQSGIDFYKKLNNEIPIFDKPTWNKSMDLKKHKMLDTLKKGQNNES